MDSRSKLRRSQGGADASADAADANAVASVRDKSLRSLAADAADAADAEKRTLQGRKKTRSLRAPFCKQLPQNAVNTSMTRANSAAMASGGTPVVASFSRSRCSKAARSTSPVSSSSMAAASK